MGTMRLMVDVRDQRSPTEVSIDRLSELLADDTNRIWLDIAEPSMAEVALLRREFGFHRLTLEEVLKPHERPHCDAHGSYYFIVVYAAEHTATEFVPHELNLFWGPNYLVTIHRNAPTVTKVLERARQRWQQHEGRHEYGVPCLAYGLFESLVDGYFTVQDRVRERIEAIEGAVFEGTEGAAVELFRLRKELLRVPRLLGPTARILAEVLRREGAIPEGLRPYFDDVQDHAHHVITGLDTYRDLLGAALDVHVFSAFNRLGLIMKRLTAVTVIIMVPNFVASVYGMNFSHLTPASDSWYAFPILVAVLGCMVVWGFIHSRLLGWL